MRSIPVNLESLVIKLAVYRAQMIWAKQSNRYAIYASASKLATMYANRLNRYGIEV